MRCVWGRGWRERWQRWEGGREGGAGAGAGREMGLVRRECWGKVRQGLDCDIMGRQGAVVCLCGDMGKRWVDWGKMGGMLSQKQSKRRIRL